MKKSSSSLTTRTFSQSAFRNWFLAGVGSMLLPFLGLAMFSLTLFEQAISQIEMAESEGIESRFLIAELKQDISKARPIMVSLLMAQAPQRHREQFQQLDASLMHQIKKIRASQLQFPETKIILKGVSDSWSALYEATSEYPNNLNSEEFRAENQKSEYSLLMRQFDEDIKDIQTDIEAIEVQMSSFQSAVSIEQVQSSEQQMRFWVGVMTLLMISITCLFAILFIRFGLSYQARNP